MTDPYSDLFKAAHCLLIRRLYGELDTKEGLMAWNDLIAAHDTVVDHESGLVEQA